MDDARRINPEWYADSFGELYPLIYAHRSVEAARDEAQFAIECVGLSRQDDVLDLACGGGRHMVHVASHAKSLTGLDYSSDLLRIAREALGDNARLIRADMRAVPVVEAFDVVFNFFTSFGYFQTEAENLSVVRSVTQALRPKGRFLIDYVNADAVAQQLIPHSVRMAGPYEVEETRWIDENARRVNKRTEVRRDGRFVQQFDESVRLYPLDEFGRLLAIGGLQIERLYGDFGGAEVAPDRPRLIAVGRRVG